MPSKPSSSSATEDTEPEGSTGHFAHEPAQCWQLLTTLRRTSLTTLWTSRTNPTPHSVFRPQLRRASICCSAMTCDTGVFDAQAPSDAAVLFTNVRLIVGGRMEALRCLPVCGCATRRAANLPQSPRIAPQSVAPRWRPCWSFKSCCQKTRPWPSLCEPVQRPEAEEQIGAATRQSNSLSVRSRADPEVLTNGHAGIVGGDNLAFTTTAEEK